MRKGIFFTIVLSLCVADFGAFAAATRADAQDSGAGRVVTRNVTRTNAGNTTSSSAVVSRAATKQKALNPGTKVATATENTAIPKECQDAFYGCMDAFCMLDNASGGRCQCSDRITELDQVLEDILKLDDQTYLMATEGVERIQMGEVADQVISRAKAAGDSVVVKDTAAAKRQTRTLDLSMWNSNVFTMEDDNLFDDADGTDLVSTFADKKGDSLYTASAKMCASQITDSCKSYSSMLQLVYAQKIKSDCTAYENSLRAQKIQSQQKLLTAEKALRDAALEEYQSQNKYATLGECTIAFTECMQTTAGCKTDYTGCVTLAAQENVRNNTAGSITKQTKIKGAIKGADITLAVSTMNQLLDKKVMCESVTKQCINANKNDAVWDAFLRNAAPALKSAELVAEQKLRSNCLPSLAECYKTACKDNYRDDEGYDACLSNPENYKSFCKVQLEPCLEATGGSYDNPTESSLWNSLIALLKAIQVDTCTAEVKTCLTDRCGSDYSECIGLDTESIGNLCPIDKLTACVQNGKYGDVNAIREYVAEIAQGLALQIDNALLTACRNAVNDSIVRVCGDNETCDSMIDTTLGTTSLDYKVCQIITDANNTYITVNQAACKESSAQITKEELGLDTLTSENKRQIGSVYSGSQTWGWGFVIMGIGAGAGGGGTDSQTKINYINVPRYTLQPGETTMYTPVISGRVNWDASFYTEYEEDADLTNITFACEQNASCDSVILNSMNNTVRRIISSIESDPRVQYCMNGRRVQGFNGFNNIDSRNNARYPNLTRQTRQDIVDQVYSKTISNYNTKLAELEAKRDEDYLEIASKYEQVLNENKQLAEAQRNATNCAALNRNNSEWNYKQVITTTYSESAKTCTKQITITECEKTKYASNPGKRTCTKWKAPTTTTEVINM